jgi:hypothetical protein
MEKTQYQPVQHASAWTAEDLADRSNWTFELLDEELDELEGAVRGVRARGLELQQVTASDFPLIRLAPKIRQISHNLTVGPGLALVTGLPARTRFSDEDTSLIFWGIGRHLGMPVSQNRRGHLLGHVLDKREQGESAKPHTRLYEAGGSFVFHRDKSDVVGLLCLRKAKQGGESLVASSMAMHNVMLEECPDQLEALYHEFYADKYGEEQPGSKPFFPTSVFSSVNGVVSANLSTKPMRDAQRFLEVPRLTSEDIEAFDVIDMLGDRASLHVSMALEEGDMQFLNNWTVVHARNDYVDYEDISLRRHMLRLWLNLPDERELTPNFQILRRGVPQVL